MERYTIVFVIALIGMFPCGLEAAQISLTVDEAVALALRDNRDILLKGEDVKKAKAQIAESHAALFPSLNASVGRSDTRGYYVKDEMQTTTQVTLLQYLYTGGRTINTIKFNEYGLQVQEALLDQTRLEIIFHTKKAFYTLLLARDFAELNREILENTNEHLAVVKQRYKNGQASGQDVLDTEASLAGVEQAYASSLHQVESSLALLSNLLYLDRDVQIQPCGEFTYEPQEVDYDQALLRALAERPEIRQYEAQEKANQRAVEIAKADNRPSIYASWDYYSRSHAIAGTAMEKNWNDYNVIGVTLSWPIFDGWATRAKVEQAMVDLKETQLMREKAAKDIALQLKDAYVSLKDAIAKMESTESEVRVYHSNLATARQKCEQGIISFLDADDANLKYEISLFKRKQVIYDYIIAQCSMEKAVGQMSPPHIIGGRI